MLFLHKVKLSHFWYMPMILGFYPFIPFISNLNGNTYQLICQTLPASNNYEMYEQFPSNNSRTNTAFNIVQAILKKLIMELNTSNVNT